MTRNYEKVKALLPDVQQLQAEGKTRKRSQSERAVKDLLCRARHKQEKVLPKQRGRKPAKTLAEYKYENKRLKMENELLRDFLQSVERKWGPNSNTRWYTGTEQNIPCPSCADFLVYPAAAIMILFAVQTGPTANGARTFPTFTPSKVYCTCPWSAISTIIAL